LRLAPGRIWKEVKTVPAVLDDGSFVSRFIYGERPNVPEYMVQDSDGDGVMDATYRLELAGASWSLGITAAELRARHRNALRAIKTVVLDREHQV